jgi:hypothetical protein
VAGEISIHQAGGVQFAVTLLQGVKPLHKLCAAIHVPHAAAAVFVLTVQVQQHIRTHGSVITR